MASNIDVKIIKNFPDYMLSDWDKSRKYLYLSISETFNTDKLYDPFAKVLHCESGSWKVGAKNPSSSASGVFQLMKYTLLEMNKRFDGKKEYTPISIEKFRKIKTYEQMKYLKWYFKLYPKQIEILKKIKNNEQRHRIASCYMMILFPLKVGLEMDNIVFDKNTNAYKANKGIKHDKEKGITVEDIYYFCINKFNSKK